jgi:O-antigen/teichoic acid export membrane protein
MLFALLSTLFRWGTPIALVGLTALFLLLRLVFGLGALEAQVLTMNLTLLVISYVIWRRFQTYQATQKTHSISSSKSPSTSALVYLLFPYFAYGTLYFAFIFADRITAGSAINPASGLIFAIDSFYQRSLDLSLLNFLLFVPFVEYFSYIFIRNWFHKAHITSIDSIKQFSTHLLNRYYRLVLIIVVCFCGLIPLTLLTLKPQNWESFEIDLTLMGSVGYLLFALALFNAIILFSLNQAIAVVKALIPGLITNLCMGYILANLINPAFAVVGLLIGATIFMILSTKSVVRAIRQPDYIYYLGGY